MADQPNTTVFTRPDQGTPNQTTAANTTGTAGDTTANPLAILVGEGRKYKSEADLAKAMIHLDDFAEKLKTENAELRQKVASAKTVDDVLERIKQSNASTQDQGADTASKGLSAEAVATIVKDTVTGMETARSRQENLLKADALLKKTFGEKAGEVFLAEANTPAKRAALTQLAEVDPEQFFKLFSKQGEGQASGSQTDSGTTVNTTALADTNQSARATDPGCKEYYDNLRRKEPGKYYSQQFQLQMNKAAVANPTKFFPKT